MYIHFLLSFNFVNPWSDWSGWNSDLAKKFKLKYSNGLSPHSKGSWFMRLILYMVGRYSYCSQKVSTMWFNVNYVIINRFNCMISYNLSRVGCYSYSCSQVNPEEVWHDQKVINELITCFMFLMEIQPELMRWCTPNLSSVLLIIKL